MLPIKVFPGRLVISSGLAPARTSLRAASSERSGSAGEKELGTIITSHCPKDLGHLLLEDGSDPQRLDVIGSRIELGNLQPFAHQRIKILGLFGEPFLVEGGRFRHRDDPAGAPREMGVRHRDLHRFRAVGGEKSDGGPDCVLDLFGGRLEEPGNRYPDPKPGHLRSEPREVVRNRRVGRRRIPWIRARDGPEHRRRVPGSTGHGARVVQGPTEGCDPEAADAAVGLLEADDSASGCRTADRATGIRADRQRHLPGRERSPGTGRGAGGRVVGGPGVSRRAESREHPAPHSELEQVELADQNGSRVVQARGDRGLIVRDPVCGGLRAVRSQDAGGREDVFGRVGNSVQGSAPIAGGDFRLCLAGAFAGMVSGHGDEGVDGGIRRLDVSEVGIHHFDG